MNWTPNPEAAPAVPYPAECRPIIDLAAHHNALAEITAWPGYEPTPLRAAPHLASELGLESVFVKDESGRFGLGSFKALGGAYGMRRVMKVPGGGAAGLTVTCASDGNHGRSVAWGARMFDCDAVVYLPAHVTEVRADAIRSFGARVVRVDDKLHEICNYLHPMDLRVCGAGFPPNDSRRVRDQPRTLLRPSSAVLSCPASGLW